MVVQPYPVLGLVGAKLQAARPHRPLMARQRLIDLARGRPIVLVVADAGYGKSTFTQEWARAVGRVLWYTLDERDRDPTTFGQHLLAAAESDPQESTTWRARGEHAADDLAQRVLRHIGQIDGPVALVLDDYHSVAESELIASVVSRLVNDRPEHLQIAIASRAPIPVPLARLRAHGLVADVSGRDLSFSQPEVATLLADENLSQADLERLVALTGGWPAAVQLLVDAWRETPPARRELGRLHTLHAHGAAVFDDFVEEEIAARIEPNDLDLLIHLSVLDEIDAETCQALVPDDLDAFDRLRPISRRFSFLVTVDEPRGLTYRMHHLVRGYLDKRMPAATRRELLGRAADAFEGIGRPVEAARAAMALGDADRVAGLIVRETMRLVLQGRLRTLGDWLDFLGHERVEADPAVLARRAVYEAECGHLHLALDIYERAVSRALEAGDRATAFWTLRAIAGVCERSGLYQRAAEGLSRALEISPDDDPAMGVRMQSQLAIMHLRRGDWQTALAFAEDALRKAGPREDVALEATMLNNYAFVLDAVGRLVEAEAIYVRALELKRKHGLESSVAFSLNNLGVNLHRQRRWAEAEAALEETVKLSREQGGVALESYGLSNLGDLLRDQGLSAKAREYYERSLELKETMGSPFALAHTWNAMAALSRRDGGLDRARALNQRALALRADEADPVERLLYRAEAERIALEAGDLERAAEALADVAPRLKQLGARYVWLHTAWWAGVAHFRAHGKLPSDFRELVETMQQPDDRPLLVGLVEDAPDFGLAVWAAGIRTQSLQAALSRETLLPRLEKAAAESPGVVELLAEVSGNAPLQVLVDLGRSGAAPVRTAAQAVLKRLRAAPPPPLEISGFGPLRVSRRGAVIPERAWRRQRSLELLGLLLLAGPRGWIRDELILHLWPDASSESGVEQFHAHLHALRAALEPESARGTSRYVLAEGRTYRLDFSLIGAWDVGAFEAAFARGDSADVVAHYRGKLFDGLTPEDDWLQLARERYQGMALEAHTSLATAFQAAGDAAGARQSWAAVLEMDPYREDACRGLIRALLTLGHKDEALAHYRRCVEVLRRELDAGPSPETVALYRAIVAT